MKSSSVNITFIKDEDDLTPVPYELEVKDFCANPDFMLSGVTVYLDGIEIGQTDTNGVIALGALIPGSQHTLKMAKGGYINSEDDKLNNDSFTIPS